MFDELMRAIQMPYEPDEARNQRNAQDIDFLKFMLLLKRIPVILKHSLRERNSWRIRLGLVVG
jgi:hypothetical protein